VSGILVTGFERFGDHRENPSERLVESLAQRQGLRTAVLPVAFRRAAARLDALLGADRPGAILLLGLHTGAEIRLERVARNRDEASGADEDGEHPPPRHIVPGGPPELASTLPLDAFGRALARREIPWAWSDDAGGFLCNHVFYRARSWVEGAGGGIPCGFVHLPPLDALPLERQQEAVAACLALLGAEPGSA